MNNCLFLLLTLMIALASAATLHDGTTVSQQLELDFAELETQASGRSLLDTKCPNGNGAAAFTVDTIIIPGAFFKTCSAQSLELLGKFINHTLFVVGSAYMPDSLFISSVCSTVSTVKTQTRRRLPPGFKWTGGGVSYNHA